jgi:hypothetical protein
MEFAVLYSPAHDFLRRNDGKEVLIVAMERHAADHIVRKYGGSHTGIHRYSLRQLIATMASGGLARQGLRPMTALSAEALAAQVIERVKLSYFGPVARTPGFPGALIETLTRLRLKEEDLPPGDLRVLGDVYEAALEEHSLAGPVEQIESAIESVNRANMPCWVCRRSWWIFGRTTILNGHSWRCFHAKRRVLSR